MVLKNPNAYEKNQTTVYFVRHGDRLETTDNTHHPGPGLSPKGMMQAKKVAKQFIAIKDEVDVIYSSTMTRAIETAQEIAIVLNKKLEYCPELSEMNRFVWETKIYHPHFWKHYKKYLAAKKCFNTILKENQGKVIIVVAHGNMMKGIIGHKMHINFKNRGLMQYDNCAITKMRFKNIKFDYLCYYNSKILD